MTLAGKWQNEYGSTMTLVVTGNRVSGIYASSTGSTGEYFVTGWQFPAEPTASAGQPVALTIEWHSIVPGTADPSWHWTSALGGQISVNGGTETLVLSHLMVASDNFPGVATAGTYVDKLTYHRVSAEGGEAQSVALEEGPVEDPLDGQWIAEDGSELSIEVTPAAENRFGVVNGTLSSSHGIDPIVGLTDINAASGGLDLQSVSLSVFRQDGSALLALGGMLDLESEQLNLETLINRSTASDATYLQTELAPMRFARS